jgi:hypothetical protein
MGTACYVWIRLYCCMAAGKENRHPEVFFRCCMHRLSTYTFFVLRDFLKVSTSFVITLYIRYIAIFALMENGWKVVTTFPFQLNSYNPPITYRRSNMAREATQWNQCALRIWNVRNVVITRIVCGRFNPLNAELNPICHLRVLLGDLTFMGPCIVSVFQYISNKMQRYTVYCIWKLLYMFRVLPPPIIRSANYIYSIWYLSYRYCYLPLSWKSWNWFECAVGGVREAMEKWPCANNYRSIDTYHFSTSSFRLTL